MRRRPAPWLGLLFCLGLSIGTNGSLMVAAGVDQGEVALGELNCVACHAAPGPVRHRLSPKQAPLLGKEGIQLTPQWLQSFLRDPQSSQPGTTMPDQLHGLPPADKAAAAEALTHYLLSLQSPSDGKVAEYDAAVVAQGRKLYHTVGCVACHAPQEAPAQVADPAQARQIVEELSANVAPLGELAAKTTVPQLAAFLKNPLASRPSGRMPASNLGDAEANAIAMYLQRAQKPGGAPASVPGLRYEYYEESLNRLPRFERLHVKEEGIAQQINLAMTRRDDNVALRFRGNLTVPVEGEYTFIILSDDGARLFIDDKQVTDNDGVHAPTEGTGRIVLTKGEHALMLVYFNGTGERALKAYWEGPNLPRQEIPAEALSHSTTPIVPVGTDPAFALDPAKVSRGRELYANLNCAACHGLEPSRAPAAKALAELDPQAPGSCIAPQAAPDRPQYTLTGGALSAVQKTLANQELLTHPLPPPEQIARTMTALNCYACHARGGQGGPEGSRRDYFTVAGEADLGDEGRFPPALDGVGAKLRPTALQAIFWQAAVARPYMATRMPQFGRVNMESLASGLPAVDHPDADQPGHGEPAPFPNAVAAGHKLVGTGGLGCIACHNFAGHPALGVPAIDMTLMNDRLNPDWFRRYLLDPQALRPGTRMPAFWPDGKASNAEVLGGDTERQIAALRLYLAQGKTAELPDGLIPAKMELVARKEAIIYRNFIAGVSPRAIGVGYPEKANLAFDADEDRLALLWQGPFIDASKQRTGRAQGTQVPLGNKVLDWTPGAPFAVLSEKDQPWPTTVGHEAGYRFRGYRLDDERRPTFLYSFAGVEVEDKPVAVPGEVDPSVRRGIRLRSTGNAGPSQLYFRAAVGDHIVQLPPTTATMYRVDDKVTLVFGGAVRPFVRRQAGKDELLVPLLLQDGPLDFVEELTW